MAADDGTTNGRQALPLQPADHIRDSPEKDSPGPGPGGGREEENVDSVIDGPLAWVVTAATFVIHFILYGFIFVMGMYFVVFLETFGRSSSQTSWISSLYLGTLCSTGPVAGMLINRWGCRVTLLLGGLVSTTGQVSSAFISDVKPMYFTFGLLIGFGHGCFLMAAVVALNQYFRKYRVIALGISLVGTAAGNIVYPYLTRYLINHHGWRGALIISGGINLQCCVAAMFVRPFPKAPPSSTNERTVNIEHGKSLWHTTVALFKDVHYWLLCGSNVAFVFGMSVLVTHILAFAKSVGLGEGKPDHLLSSLGIASLVGRGLTALIAQHKRVNIILFLVFCYVIAGVAVFLYGINRTFIGLLLSVLLYGLFSSPNGSVSAEYASLVIGSGRFATGYGYVMFCNGIGAVSGAPVAGFLYDSTRFYPSSFYLSSSFMILSGLLMLPTYLARRNQPPAATAPIQLAEKSLVNGETERFRDASEV